MRTLSATLGFETPISAKALAVDTPGFSLGTPLAQKEESKIPRVARAELEAAYLLDGVTFNIINTAVELVMIAGHSIAAKDKDVLNFFEAFVNNIGNVGHMLTWEDLVTSIVAYECIYGDVLVERIRGKGGNIVDLDMIDPKRHDYAKDTYDKIALDKFGRPIGYTQKIDSYKSLVVKQKGVDFPEGINRDVTAIFLPRENVSHFKLFRVGDGLRGIGYIEPAYKTVLRKLNIQQAQGNAAFRHSTPLFFAKVGDENHEPTPQIVEDILEKVKKARNNYDVSFPYFIDLEILESRNSGDITKHLGYLGKEETAASGTPQPFATGAGEATNRATLRDQARLYEIKLQWLANHIARQIEDLIFKPIAFEQGFDEVPRIVWGPVGIGNKEKGVEMLLKFVQAGVISVGELRSRIKELGILDIKPEEIPVLPDKGTAADGREETPFTKEEKIRSEDEDGG